MPTETRLSSTDSLAHARQLTRQLQDLRDQFREEMDRVEDPRAQALFETSSEVLGGLIKALTNFQTKSDKSWHQQ